MIFHGLDADAVKKSRAEHGTNVLTQLPLMPLWLKMIKGLKDPMIIILLVALAIQVILFFTGQAEWFEPIGILVAIIIANGVAAVSEANQESKASALKAAEEAKEMTKAVRDGVLQELHVSEIVVGDIVFVQAGDKFPADGEVIHGSLKVDQATLNGETEEAEKYPCAGDEKYDDRDLLNLHYVYRGTVVCSGEGYVEIKVVGDRTLFGELALEVQGTVRATPLQVKLTHLAGQISTFGYIGATAIVAGVIIRTLCAGAAPEGFYEWLDLIINSVTVAVTIIVCAVPEGLPMLTSILLSLQSLKMAKDNVLVRKINGLETAGSLSILFSDKTGTITEGRLSVVELVDGNAVTLPPLMELQPELRQDIINGAGVNNSAVLSGGNIIGGNSTDRALLGYIAAEECGDRIARENIVEFSAFDSNRKSSSVTLMTGSGEVTYLKGAPEKIIERCRTFRNYRCGTEEDISGVRDGIYDYLDAQAERSMRLLAIARKNGRDDGGNDLTLVCVLSIRDNVRKDASEAIKEVMAAGIQVVMVTGDRKETATAIAREAGLLTGGDEVAMTSAEMAEKSDAELREILPRLRVVARALPLDKSRLVRIAQELNLVVGMTGDGVNDSPALKKADVGFAMGSGTEVAKEAGDITILDDKFSSIAKAILYGRTMFKSIRKFLIFQLTVNVAAVLTCFLGPMFGINVVMTVVQLLFVNLAMDTLAAIAFGSEPALKEYMRDKPVPRDESIVTGGMFIEIMGSALYITLAVMAILFWQPLHELMGTDNTVVLKTAVFATFMMAIIFNGFNARTAHVNPLYGIGGNRNFLIIMFSIVLLQYFFVTFGGEILSVQPLSARIWGICALLALFVVPIGMIRKVICRWSR